MPYARSLQAYCADEFYAQPHPDWEKRLREVSPITSDLDHLRFRKFEPREWWFHKDRPQWMLYSCRPIRLVHPDRAAQFQKHWSELPSTEQEGRKSFVSDYQHFMWHSQGLYVKPFLILQGEWGGTPAKYTEQERAFLESSDCLSEPFPLGFFPACPFDERVVTQIATRDRLLKAANDWDALIAMDSAAGLKDEDELAAKVRRDTYLDTWKVMIQPAADFMGHWLKRSENRDLLPDAPAGMASAIDRWRDHFVQHGSVIGAKTAVGQRSTQVQVA